MSLRRFNFQVRATVYICIQFNALLRSIIYRIEKKRRQFGAKSTLTRC